MVRSTRVFVISAFFLLAALTFPLGAEQPGFAPLEVIFLETPNTDAPAALGIHWLRGSAARLSIWIDLDADGNFTAAERLADSWQLDAEMLLVDVPLPADASLPTLGNARFEITYPAGHSQTWEEILWDHGRQTATVNAPAKGIPGCNWDSGFHLPGIGSNGTSVEVRTLAVWDDGNGPALYAGGVFVAAGASDATYLAKWDGTAWSPVGSGMNNTVSALAVFDDGGGPALFAAGTFLQAGGGTVNRIAKWDGVSWSALDGGMDNEVRALAVHDDGGGPALYAGGFFLNAGGTPATRIAKWDGTSWSALSSGMDDAVLTLASFDDGGGAKLIAGGRFDTAGGVATARIAQWNGSAWSGMAGTGMDSDVAALVVFDDGSGPDLYAGGWFTSASGVSTARVARWNGSAWSALGVGVDNNVRSLGVFDDGNGPALYAGGNFANAGDNAAQRVAKWDGTTWAPLGTGVSSQVSVFAAFDDGKGSDLYLGGFMNTAGDLAVSKVARWDGRDWSPVSSLPSHGVSNDIEALEIFDDGFGPALYAGGQLANAGLVRSPGLARFDGDTWSAIGEATGVYALEVFDDGTGPALYAGGRFTVLGGVAASHVARWDGSTFAPLGLGVNDDVHALQVFDDGTGPALYAAGDFTNAGGSGATRIAKWDGTTWSPLAGGPNRTVEALAVFDDGTGEALYVAGDFTTTGGVSASRVAKWDGTAWSQLSSGANARTYALGVFDDGGGPALYAGGDFTSAGGLNASHIAKWNGSTWSALGLGVGSRILGMAAFDDGGGPALYVGGNFTSAGGFGADRIARWDGSAWSSLGKGTNTAVNALAIFDGGGTGPALYAGGDFLNAGDTVSSRIARYTCPGLAPVPVLHMPALSTVDEGGDIELPIHLETDGQALASTAFSIDYDSICLDPDLDADGTLDTITVDLGNVPADFTVTVLFDPLDSDGEIDISIADLAPPFATLGGGELVRIGFRAVCAVAAPGPVVAPVDFSLAPDVTFGDLQGQAIDGLSTGGVVEVWPGLRGDCNRDGALGAADLTAVALEIFDADGDFWQDAPASTFAGSPAGCDANASTRITSADVTCTNLRLFGLLCGSPTPPGAPLTGTAPELEVATVSDGSTLWIRGNLQRNGHAVGSLALSLDLSPVGADFGQVDANNDGRPDLLSFPNGEPGLAIVAWNPADGDGELDILLADLDQQPLTDGMLFEVGIPLTAPPGNVRLSAAPEPSFGAVDGTDLEGIVILPVIFADGFESGGVSAWSVVVLGSANP